MVGDGNQTKTWEHASQDASTRNASRFNTVMLRGGSNALTVFDRSFEQYSSFEHLHFPQSFAISPRFFGIPQLFIKVL